MSHLLIFTNERGVAECMDHQVAASELVRLRKIVAKITKLVGSPRVYPMWGIRMDQSHLKQSEDR